ncbi:MAG: MurR/RpiR family transcriptional regulator [Eubacteriales bacterium]|nr:MurR/RpiR family transcriptional regulator [Eubacteriales bacterium]
MSDTEEKLMSANSEILLTIKTQLQRMNPAQLKVGRYILENPERVVGMPIGHLAAECSVSEATISRFVKFLGCVNYRAFQTEMAKNSVAGADRIRGYTGVESTHTTEGVLQTIFQANMQSLADTLAIADIPALEEAADMIVKRRKLVILAQGRSTVTANSIRQRLYRLGIDCASYSDPHEQAVVTSLLGEEDVVMGISTFGRSRTLLKNLRFAASNGTSIIGVSSYRGTPLERVANIMLVASSNEDASLGFEPSCSTISQMVLLDCLYILITNRMREEAKQCFRITCQAIESERE